MQFLNQIIIKVDFFVNDEEIFFFYCRFVLSLMS
jgi:hypothetical protein